MNVAFYLMTSMQITGIEIKYLWNRGYEIENIPAKQFIFSIFLNRKIDYKGIINRKHYVMVL